MLFRVMNVIGARCCTQFPRLFDGTRTSTTDLWPEALSMYSDGLTGPDRRFHPVFAIEERADVVFIEMQTKLTIRWKADLQPHRVNPHLLDVQPSLLHPLHNDRTGATATVADPGASDLSLLFPKHAQQRRHDPRSRCTKRVTQSDGATVQVDLGFLQTQ